MSDDDRDYDSEVEGEWTPAEAAAWHSANTLTNNLAGDEDRAKQVIRYVNSIHTEWSDRMRNMWRRWKATYYMLSGNTLERGGPADIHVPEIYKAIETMVPRLEEVVLDREPWFRIVPRREKDRDGAEANAAYIEWQFEQAKIRDLIHPAIRDMLITQISPFYCRWENRESMRNVREVKREIDKSGRLKKTVKIKRKSVIDYSGPTAQLVDPFDFIMDTKATDPQKATFVGHRFWMTVDEIRRIGKASGWTNLSELDKRSSTLSPYGSESDAARWPRDPTSLFGNYLNQTGLNREDERPEKMEVVILYSKWSLDQDENYDDYQMIVVGGKTCVDLRINPHDGGYRPYALMRDTKSGHELFGTGVFDNAIRINQHLDRYHQITLRAAEVSACPMVFAEEDSDLPDSLYKVRPFSVFKGVGPVRFTQVPDGTLRAAPMILGMLTNNIEETVGNFRINMGQNSNGTATEASLSLEEGNRRNRGHVRGMASGLEQLLTLFHKLNLQYSVEDVEFPVLGKRAIDLKRDYVNIGPADLLDDVKFEMVGLKSSRTYGMRQTGLIASMNVGMPLIAANPDSVDQVYMLHTLISETLGPEEADRIVRMPTPPDKLKSQFDENIGLLQGERIEVDPNDDHQGHIEVMVQMGLLPRAMSVSSDMPLAVREAVLAHFFEHQAHDRRRKAVEKSRQTSRGSSVAVPEEAGGSPSSSPPPPGGMSNAMAALGDEPSDGQTPLQNPGPPDVRKYGRGTRGGRTINQSEDRL